MMEELDTLSPLHLRFTINNWENVVRGFSKISVFQFNGGKYTLEYTYNEYGFHELALIKEFGHCRHPIDACVQVESSGKGRIVSGLSRHELFDNVNGFWNACLWWEQEYCIRQMVPGFRNRPMTWFIVLKEVYSPKVSATQTKCNIPEVFEMSCMESLSADYAQLMARGSDHDMVFMCSGESIGAHSAVMCGRSKVIAAMLRSDMVEGRTRVITIPDVEPDVFKHFLRYLYCGKLDELTCHTALALYELGDQYAVLGLVKRCSQFLLEHLSPENACDVLTIADLHSDEDFAEKIITYMVEAAVPQMSDRWPAFRENNPKLAIKVQEKKRRSRKRKFSFRWERIPKSRYDSRTIANLLRVRS